MPHDPKENEELSGVLEASPAEMHYRVQKDPKRSPDDHSREFGMRQRVGLLVGPLAFLVMLLIPTPDGMSTGATTVAYANHLIFLFMGGFIIALAMQRWDLHRRIALHVIRLTGFSPGRLVFGFMLATAAMLMPVLAGIAVGMGQSPLILLAPAALAASCAFMLPVATPPNAIVFGSGYVTIPQMVRSGMALNVMGIILIPLCLYFLVIPVFEIVMGELPAWVR